MKISARPTVLVALLVCSAGCSTTVPYEPAPEGAARLEMLVVQAEVCLRVALPPTNKQPNVQVARRYGPHGEGRSVGGSIIEPVASTPAGQAVFESFDA